MNGKKRYIPIVALGALLLSLLAILPVAAAGEVDFIVPGDINENNSGALTDTTPDTQEWARQGGQIGILIDDSDLNVTVKRVLLPGIDSEDVGDAEIKRNSKVIKFTYANVQDLAGTDGKQTFERNDLIMVDRETLRKATKVEWVDENDPTTPDNAMDDTLVVTLDRAFSPDSDVFGTATEVHRVKQTYVKSTSSAYNAFDGDGYKTLASALRFNDPEVDLTYPGNVNSAHTDVELDRDIVDSGIGSHVDLSDPGTEFNNEFRDSTDKGLSHRLKSAPARGVRTEDVLVLKVANPTNPATITIDPLRREPIGVSAGGTFRLNGNFSQIPGTTPPPDTSNVNIYVLFWASEENDTGSIVTVRSQAHQTQVPLVLRETTANSGEFAARVDLIPAQLSVSWDDIPADDGGSPTPVAYTSGDVVELENDSNTNATYVGYKVKYPTATRPATVTADTPLQNVETVADFNEFARAIPRLPVNLRDTVSVRHPDDAATIRVETTPSVFSRFSPDYDSAVQDSRPELEAQVVDGDSGLKDSDIDFIYTVDDGAVNTLNPSDDGYTQTAPNGFTVRARVTRVDDDTDRVIKWWVKAKDKAGNVSYSDHMPTVDGRNDKCVATTDAEAVAPDSKCQPRIITVDNTDPDMIRAETGRFWDNALSTGSSDDKTEYRASEASSTTVLVIFDEYLHIDSVQASDFEVNDATPQSAVLENVTVRDDNFQTYAESPNATPEGSLATDDDPDTGDGNKAIVGDSVQDEGLKRGYVFLTVSEMTSNAKPKVELVNNVEDIAGNSKSSDAITEATDRIGPDLTVTFSGGDRPVTNGKVEFTVTSDEDIGSPTIRYARVRSTKVQDGDSVQLLDTARTDAVVNFRSAKEYGVEITPPSDGLYTVFVEADDSAGGNPGTKGDKKTLVDDATVSIDVDGETDALLFERDKTISKPDIDPGRTGVQDKFETDDANGYIRIDYSAEASEYYNAGDSPMVCNQQVVTPNCSQTDTDPDTTGNQAPDKAAVTGDDLDTYGRVTIVRATLNGEDISGDLTEDDDNIFLYHLDGIATGDHELEVVARDDAGNQNAAPHKGTIKVIERKKYELKLNPGWNFVSLPGQPADTDVNAVIPADHPISAIRTFDRASGGWLVAEEDGEGRFIGPLVTGDRAIGFAANNAYMVFTDSSQSLMVDIPKIPAGAQVFLPTINIEQGWNMVPILDPDGDFRLNDGEDQTADDNYFTGLADGTIVHIYGHNLITNRWVATKEHEVALGKGYWVYAAKPGVIVP